MTRAISMLSICLAVVVLAGGVAAGASTVVQTADFRDSFGGLVKANDQAVQTSDPGTPWRFQWNASGTIGTAANYADLTWSLGQYTTNGTGPFPAPAPGAYASINGSGGHPGQGSAQASDGIDRYAIAGYQIQPGQAGRTFLNLGVAKNQGNGGNIDVQVYVNDTLRVDKQSVRGTALSYDLGALNAGDTVYVAVGPDGEDGWDGSEWDANLTRVATSPNARIVANFQANFPGLTKTNNQPVQASDPGTPWRFEWNATGPIGSAAGYADLTWSLGQYTTNGTGAFPAPAPGAYASINGSGGHPGQGSTQAGDGLDRYILASYIIDEWGWYDLLAATGTFVNDNGVDVEVYVNDSLITAFDGAKASAFHADLGELYAGDVVRLAVGPNARDWNDGTSFDFTLVQTVPEPCSLVLLLVGLGGAGAAAWRRRRISRDAGDAGDC